MKNIIEDYLYDSPSTPPGRVVSYLTQTDNKLDPVSCRLLWWDNDDVPNFVKLLIKYLARGAGVKVILDEYRQIPPIDEDVRMVLTLSPEHSDFTQADQVHDVVGSLFFIGDSLDSISYCLGLTYQYLLEGKDITLDFSNIRAKGTTNKSGMVASGPHSFMRMFQAMYDYLQHPCLDHLLRFLGTINQEVRRGGVYKNGIITTEMVDTNPHLVEYLEVDKTTLPGSHSKALTLSKKPSGEFLQWLVELRNRESLFLSKLREDGRRPNVCEGIFLKDRGTCLIWRVNLGKIHNLSDLEGVFRKTTRYLTQLHYSWERNPDWDVPAVEDRQVGLCVMGFVNLLKRFNLTYQGFIDAASLYLDGELDSTSPYYPLMYNLERAYRGSVEEMQDYCHLHQLPELELMHTVEPAQTHSYRTKDLDGNPTCRGLYPPLTERVVRMSDTYPGVYHYPGFPTIRDEVTKEQIFQVHSLWMEFMSRWGKPHAISYDTYHEMTEDDLLKWYDSPLQTMYYHKGGDLTAAKQVTKIDLVKSCSENVCTVCGE